MRVLVAFASASGSTAGIAEWITGALLARGQDVVLRSVEEVTGVITAATFGKFGALLVRAMGCRFGDFRDWAEIEKWSASIADALAEQKS
jgi:hypothetical protein